ncbi:hypothetical protein M427DRAFT_97187, partial [Gonapodya prolifera JEL478]
ISAGVPRHRQMATRCSSPPERASWRRVRRGTKLTDWSMMLSMLRGFSTSVLNCGCMNICLIRLRNNIRTDENKFTSNLGLIFCGLYDTCISGMMASPPPAIIRMNVVLPVPFSPSMTIISESVNSPAAIKSSPIDLDILGYRYRRILSCCNSSAVSARRKVRLSSLNLKFSVGMTPSKKMLMPSRTEKGMVTTPYAEGTPYRQQMKSDR